MEKRMSSDFDRSVRFFGRFTWKDLLRLGIPVGVVLYRYDVAEMGVEAAPIVVTAALVSLFWYSWRPHSEPIDAHLFHIMRWIFRVFFL